MRVPSLAFLALVACGEPALAPSDAGADAHAARQPPSHAAPAPVPAAETPRVAVPAGVVLAGSRPGTPFRRPALEADLVSVEVPTFTIDRRAHRAPSRSDPLRVSANDAGRACEEAGARLCDELEWERACEGDSHHPFATGATFESCLARPEACVAESGVIAPGVEAPEWTIGVDGYVLRGARADQAAALHRCDARVPLASPVDREAAVRCCTGPRPSLPYPTPTASPAFAPLTLSPEALGQALASTPELAPYASSFDAFDRTDSERAYARAGLVVDEITRARLADGPLAWSPVLGELVWLVYGRAGNDTILAALYPLADGTVVHAASFVFVDEAAPLALVPVPSARREVSWATRAGTAGETGSVRFDDDGVVRVVAH